MAHDTCELSVVIPAYNESERIARTLAVTAACLGRKIASWEIIVVDDGSADDTAGATRDAIRDLRLGRKVRLVSYSPNQGKGWALRQGVLAAGGRNVAFFDADLDIAPEHIVAYYGVLVAEKADAVVASKRHPESVLEYARSRVFISNLYYWFNRLFFGLNIKDTQSGMKMFRREILLDVLPRLLGKRFAFDLELLVNIRRLGGVIIEQPVTIQGHDTFGRIGLMALWHAFIDTLAIFYRMHIQRFYDWKCLPSRKKNLPDIAVFVFTSGYGRAIEDICRHLGELEEKPAETVLIAPQADFRIPGTTVFGRGRLSADEALLAAARTTKAEVIVCLDEDSRPQNGWLERAARYLALPEVDAVTGPQEIAPGQGFSRRLAMRILRNPLLPVHPYSRFNRSRQHLVDRNPCVNLFVRRQVLVARTLLDPDEGGKPYLVHAGRFFAADRMILYSPDVVLPTIVPAVGRPLARRLSRLGHARGELLAGFPGHLVRLRDYFPVFLLIAFVIGCAFSFGSVAFWEYWRWLMSGWFLAAFVSSGYLFRLHKAFLTTIGVFFGNMICGVGFLKGLFGIGAGSRK